MFGRGLIDWVDLVVEGRGYMAGLIRAGREESHTVTA